MTAGVSPTRRPNAAQSGGAALNVLIFVAGMAVILALVIHLEKNGSFDRIWGASPRPLPPAATTPPAVTTQTPAPDEHPLPVVRPDVPPKPPHADNETVAKVPKPVEPAFTGDAEYKFYHRRDCKLVQFIGEGKKVLFASASEAFDKGFIPCKVCKPEVPGTPTVGKTPEDLPKAVSNKLVGDADRRRYHRADCIYVKSIQSGRAVPFKSAAEALNREYYPCRTCNPDLPELLAELPPSEIPASAGNLTEPQKQAMYKSLFALKEMLKGISTAERPYEVLSDRYHVPTSAVRAVEAEGNGKNWPQR